MSQPWHRGYGSPHQCPDGAADPERPHHPHGFSGQHEPDPDPGQQPDHRAVAAVRELLPGGHHRSGPGPVRGAVPSAECRQEEHRRIDDGKAYGAGLAETFSQEATKLGAKVVAREKVGETDTDFSGVIAKIRPLSPDAVYYGGEYPAAGPLSAQLAKAGLNIPLMGGDGIIDQQYITLGGRAGDLATVVGAPAEQLLPGSAQFIADYQTAHYAEPYSAYGAPTFDATNIVIAALAAAVHDSPWSTNTRADVVRNVQATNLEGLTGPITFDRYGDTTNKVLTVYAVAGGTFTAVDGSTGRVQN